jgi:outer membrane biosynthesis protein TonB
VPVAKPAPAPAAPPKAAATPPAAPATAPPPVEVITAPPPPQAPENGVSAVRDVTLEPGVPDLAKGRRPVAPPLARMSGVTGTVEVAFSVSAGGVTSLQTTSGPEVLRPAAEQAVATWTFRRARADRAYLVAVFNYTGDKGSAIVRPQAEPPPARP